MHMRTETSTSTVNIARTNTPTGTGMVNGIETNTEKVGPAVADRVRAREAVDQVLWLCNPQHQRRSKAMMAVGKMTRRDHAKMLMSAVLHSFVEVTIAFKAGVQPWPSCRDCASRAHGASTSREFFLSVISYPIVSRAYSPSSAAP